jgi:hypothetical protein
MMRLADEVNASVVPAPADVVRTFAAQALWRIPGDHPYEHHTHAWDIVAPWMSMSRA